MGSADRRPVVPRLRRMYRAAVLAGVLLLWLLVGPWVVVLAVAGLAVPRVREAVRPPKPRRVAVAGAVAAALLTGLVLVVPDGWLPMPPGPGRWVTPGYTGRPAIVRPLPPTEVPSHPHLAPEGTATADGDAWSGNAQSWPGPTGEQPEVDTAWFGGEGCGTLLLDSRDRLVALCDDGAELRLFDADNLRQAATKELGDPAAEAGPPCGQAMYLDEEGRAVVAAPDARILAVATADGEGEADLTVAETHDIGRAVVDDCVVALLPDWGGRTWFASRNGVVGVLDPESGQVRATDLGEKVGNGLAADPRGGMYAVTSGALYRLTTDDEGRPRVSWRTQYDGGVERKPGQLAQASGTAPTLLPGGLVAIGDNADPRMRVVVVRQDDGAKVCEVPVFGEGESATEQSLVSVGTGVVVVNGYGYAGARSTALGRATPGGLTRVDVAGDECRIVWTSDLVVPSSGAELSLPNGLLYAWTKRGTLWGAAAWYLSAVDVHTGRHVFSVRTGTGLLVDNDRAAVTLAPDGSAYTTTLGGVVRVRDDQRD